VARREARPPRIVQGHLARIFRVQQKKSFEVSGAHRQRDSLTNPLITSEEFPKSRNRLPLSVHYGSQHRLSEDHREDQTETFLGSAVTDVAGRYIMSLPENCRVALKARHPRYFGPFIKCPAGDRTIAPVTLEDAGRYRWHRDGLDHGETRREGEGRRGAH